MSVRGPGTRLILSLRRVGWEAVGPDKWTDNLGGQWKAYDEALNMDALLDAIAAATDGVLIERVAKHWQGEGAQ